MTTASTATGPAVDRSRLNLDATIGPEWEPIRRRALFAGVGGLLLCAVGALFGVAQVFRSYLVGFTFWLGVALGSLVLLMLQHLTGGAWGVVLRRVLEAAARTVPLLLLMFLPVLLGMNYLYPWLDPQVVEEHAELRHKAVYLNAPFFVVRALIYFGTWTALAHVLTRWSLEQDRAEAPTSESERRFRLVSAPGLLLYGLTVTFASVDWLMSLEPAWYSTMYPVLFATSQVLTAFAFAVVTLLLLAAAPPLSEVLLPAHLRDLGSLLLAFVLLWAYMSISQFLLIWSGNLPEEIPWYLRRTRGGWEGLAMLLVVGHFALPFLLLLSRDIKRNRRTLAAVAGGILVMRFLDILWWVEPAFPHEGYFPFWLLDAAAVVGLGGFWVYAFLGLLRRGPLLPIRDPYLEEALHHE